MQRYCVLLFFVVGTMSSLVHAHAKLSSTVPADGDFVEAPSVLVLNFANDVQLTGVELKTVEGGSKELGSFSSMPAKTFNIAVTGELEPGEYYLVWRSIAADSHFSTGEFFFTVVSN